MQYTEIFFPTVKLEKFTGKKLMFLILLLKTLIVGTNYNTIQYRERGGVGVEHRTPNQEVLGKVPTSDIVLCQKHVSCPHPYW